jgi:Tol biopolymer transport system component
MPESGIPSFVGWSVMNRSRSRDRAVARIVAGMLLGSLFVFPARAAPSEAPERGGEVPAAIVFARLQGDPGDHEIWTMGARGGSQRRLTRNHTVDLEPTWSPDGTTIAWVRYEQGTFNSDIWLMDADGTNKHKLTDHGTDITGPTWSPDGTRLAYTRDHAIWVIGVDGTGEHRISPQGSFDFDPAWSPDGTRIAFASSGAGTFDLYVMNQDGSGRHRLAETVGAAEHDPAWSPDGGRIAYSGSYAAGSWHVSMMRSDGTGRHIVIDLYSLYPAWSPDGSRIAFYACGETDCGLYRSNVRGRHVRELGRRREFSDVQPDYRSTIPPA